MYDPIFEALDEIFGDEFEIYIKPDYFQILLEERGFMIVPIEDPTNLRYGEDD